MIRLDVLGVGGSHRRGNTDILVERALKVCERSGLKTTFVSLSNKNICYCTDCGACKQKEDCPIEDDVQPILDDMKRARAIIVGSPTYFSSVSGKLKSLFDRTLPLRRNGFLLSGKVGGAIAVGGSRNGGQEHVVSEIHSWMLLQEMMVVSDKTTAHFGGIAVGRNPGDVLKDEVGLATIGNLAEKIVETLKCQK